jgi:hypothetical protein
MPTTSSKDLDLPAGLAQPALRALAGAAIQTLVQLSRYSEAQISRLHGIVPSGLEKLRRALAENGLAF